MDHDRELHLEPLHVVHLCGEVIVYAPGFEYIMAPAAAEETSRRLASVAAVAQLQQYSPV